MKKILLAATAMLLISTITASAYDLTCNAPRVLFGDDASGNPVVSVDIRYTPEDHAWRIFHNMQNGLVVSRSEQYAIQDASTDDMAQWQGSHGRQRHLYMVGEVRRGADNGIYYHEWQYNRNTNTMLMQSKALCRPVVAKPPLVMQTEQPTPRPQGETVMRFIIPHDVSGGHMKVRRGPGTNFSLLGAIPAGQRVTAVRCAPREDGLVGADWCLVTWGDLIGWVSRVGLMPTS